MVTGQSQCTQRKTCSRATLPTINLTWANPGPDPGLRGEDGDGPLEPWHGIFED
jgi:hypothetical protein